MRSPTVRHGTRTTWAVERRCRPWGSTFLGTSRRVAAVSGRSPRGRRRSSRGSGVPRGRPRWTRGVDRSGRRTSCEPPSFQLGLGRIGLEGPPKRADRPMESRLGRAEWDAERRGSLRQGQPEVVVQDDDRSMLRAEPGERPVDLVAVGDERFRRVSTRRGSSRSRPRSVAVVGSAPDRCRRGRSIGGARHRTARGREAPAGLARPGPMPPGPRPARARDLGGSAGRPHRAA